MWPRSRHGSSNPMLTVDKNKGAPSLLGERMGRDRPACAHAETERGLPKCEEDRTSNGGSVWASSITSSESRFPDPAMPEASIGVPKQAALRMEMQDSRFVPSSTKVVKPVCPKDLKKGGKPKPQTPEADRRRPGDMTFRANMSKSRLVQHCKDKLAPGCVG